MGIYIKKMAKLFEPRPIIVQVMSSRAVGAPTQMLGHDFSPNFVCYLVSPFFLFLFFFLVFGFFRLTIYHYVCLIGIAWTSQQKRGVFVYIIFPRDQKKAKRNFNYCTCAGKWPWYCFPFFYFFLVYKLDFLQYKSIYLHVQRSRHDLLEHTKSFYSYNSV